MSIIKITPESLTYNCRKFSHAADEINRINNDIASLVSALDWEVRSRGSVESMIDRAVADGRNLAGEVERLAQYLKTAANLFQEADANGEKAVGETTCKLTPNIATFPGVTAAGLLAGLFAGEKLWLTMELGWLKKIMGIGNSESNSLLQNSPLNRDRIIIPKYDASDWEQRVSSLENKIRNLHGTKFADEGYKNAIQCKGFAKKMFYETFRIDLPATLKNKYELDYSPEISKVNQIISKGDTITAPQVKDFFASSPAHKGDVVQMYWKGIEHTAIFFLDLMKKVEQ